MGIAWLLLRRTFTTRPKRTLLFILGYALATAVMITLLSVGEAVLLQAQDKDLLGGGDLILVPQGVDIESLKVGGLSALYYTIPHARFIVRQILGSSRFQHQIQTVSPYIVSKLMYARTKGSHQPEIAFAEGSLPDQEKALKGIPLPWKNQSEDQAWLRPAKEDFYHEIDHFHLPAVENPEMQRWAEWHYFNFESEDFYGYLSIMVAGNVLTDQANWIVSLQLSDGAYRRFSQTVPARKEDLPLQRVDYHAGYNAIRFQDDHYEISLDFRDRVPISGKLSYYPASGLYFPPAVLARSKDLESGYVIPALRGNYAGTLRVGSQTYKFDTAVGYHDHNWGIWRRIEWNWGHAYGKEHSIFFGEVLLEGKTKGLFLGIYDQHGFLSIFRPEHIQFSDYQKRPEGIKVPMKMQIRQKKQFASLSLDGTVRSLVTTPVDDDHSLYFIQYRMDYDISLEIDGKTVRFPAGGNAETFVRGSNPQQNHHRDTENAEK